MKLLCSVELRNTTTRSAAYHVDLREEGGQYFVVIRYGAIGRSQNTKKGMPFRGILAAAADYDAKVQAKMRGEYKHYAGDVSVPQRVFTGTSPEQTHNDPHPRSRTKATPVTQSAAQVLAAALARKPSPIQSSKVTAAPHDEDVVYDDL